MKTPCKECPYRIDSAPGYLGNTTGRPERFLQQLDLQFLHPCHLQVDWESEDADDQILEAETCIGALQFMNNSCKSHRNSFIRDQQKEAGKNENVLAFNHNFISHHTI